MIQLFTESFLALFLVPRSLFTEEEVRIRFKKGVTGIIVSNKFMVVFLIQK